MASSWPAAPASSLCAPAHARCAAWVAPLVSRLLVSHPLVSHLLAAFIACISSLIPCPRILVLSYPAAVVPGTLQPLAPVPLPHSRAACLLSVIMSDGTPCPELDSLHTAGETMGCQLKAVWRLGLAARCSRPTSQWSKPTRLLVRQVSKRCTRRTMHLTAPALTCGCCGRTGLEVCCDQEGKSASCLDLGRRAS